MQRPRFLRAVATAALASTATARGAAEAAPANVRAGLHKGQRLVAFVVSDMATVIDFAGPWEVFQDTPLPGADDSAFVLYMVGETTAAIEATAGMLIAPRYTFADAPRPDIVVVGAQKGTPGLVPWLQAQAATAEVIMSVCTGAFKVAAAGLFDGKSATTHHGFYDRFAAKYPKVHLVRGPRFVDQGRVCSAGGLTSGIDLALHVVERLHGKTVADNVAGYMEFVRTARPAPERTA